MIITYPTGFYSTVLPKAPGDSGNVTFTISAVQPPRTNLVFPKIPRGVVERQRIPVELDEIEIRAALGERVFAVSRASTTVPGNSARQFELGQILEFGDLSPNSVDPMLVTSLTETRHDTNICDYDALGLDAAEQELLANSALEAHIVLQANLSAAKTGRANAEHTITTQQKIYNEARRNISALEVVLAANDDPDVEKLLVKFQDRADVAAASVAEATTLANSYAAQAAELQDQLLALAVVVK